jgi:hypothetical protein
MGMFMREDDMYIEGMLEVLNLRFGLIPDVQDTPADTLAPDENLMLLNTSGIREMHAIQAQFTLFQAGTPLVQSMRALGVGGQWNAEVKRKWFKLLNRLDKSGSNVNDATGAPLTGGAAIVVTLADHLRDRDPDPVHFQAHDANTEPRVMVQKNDRPIFYIQQDFLTVSLPMKARPIVAAPGQPGQPHP